MSDMPSHVTIKEVGPREGFHPLPGKLKSGGNLEKYRARARAAAATAGA